jgi:hypothetical protein
MASNDFHWLKGECLQELVADEASEVRFLTPAREKAMDEAWTLYSQTPRHCSIDGVKGISLSPPLKDQLV